VNEVELKSSWAWIALNEYITIVRGISFPKTAKRNSYSEGLVACLRTANVQKEVEWGDLWFVDKGYMSREEQLVEPDDILVSNANSLELLGKVAKVKETPYKSTIGTFITLFRVSKESCPKFVYYYLLTHEFRKEVRARASTTTNISNVSVGKLETIKIRVAPLQEQQRIVNKIEELFSKLDTATENLNIIKSKLKIYRHAILKSAFEGKLTEEWRKEHFEKTEPSQILLEKIKKNKVVENKRRLESWKLEVEIWERQGENGKKPRKPRLLTDGNLITAEERQSLKELPSTAIWVKLGQIFEVFVGSTPSRTVKEYWNGDIKWVSSGEVAFNHIYKTKENITDAGLENSSTTIHPVNTIMLAMIGEGKTRGQAAILKTEAAHNQNTAAIRTHISQCSPQLLYYYLYYQYEYNRMIGSGNNQKALNKDRVENLLYPLFPLTEQMEILNRIESRLAICDKLEDTIEQSLKQSEVLRQSLLKKAFEGDFVPQDSNDEPVEKLIERIRLSKIEKLTQYKVNKRRGKNER
jgi:type I restriction enzyme, S subunit